MKPLWSALEEAHAKARDERNRAIRLPFLAELQGRPRFDMPALVA
jgi:hypothetical protein